MHYKPNVIMADDQTFEDVIYGAPSKELSRYLSEKITQASNFITDKTRTFYKRSLEIYNQMSGDKARKRIADRMLINNASLSNEIISRIDKDASNIGNLNRRYLMANPELYNLKRKGRINGFESAYEDIDRHVQNPYWKRDYLSASDGLVKIESATNKLQYTTIVKDDNELAFSQQVIINRNWELANRLLVDDIDITSID